MPPVQCCRYCHVRSAYVTTSSLSPAPTCCAAGRNDIARFRGSVRSAGRLSRAADPTRTRGTSGTARFALLPALFFGVLSPRGQRICGSPREFLFFPLLLVVGARLSRFLNWPTARLIDLLHSGGFPAERLAQASLPPPLSAKLLSLCRLM